MVLKAVGEHRTVEEAHPWRAFKGGILLDGPRSIYWPESFLQLWGGWCDAGSFWMIWITPERKTNSPFLGMICAQVNGQQQIQQIHWFRAKLTSSESARGRSQRSSRESGFWLHDWENNFLFLSFSKGQSVILNQCFHRTCSWRCHIQPLNRFMT